MCVRFAIRFSLKAFNRLFFKSFARFNRGFRLDLHRFFKDCASHFSVDFDDFFMSGYFVSDSDFESVF